MRLLELFKGTGSVSKVFIDAGWEVVSLDIAPKFKPTHLCDILDFDYKQYQPKHFDIIWASPECKIYSRLMITNIRANRKYKTREELDQARQEHSKYVEKALEIIEYLEPTEWYIENPYYSAMKDLPCMSQLGSHRFDYCRFGFDYQKPTRIWTNRTDLEDITCSCLKRKHKYKIGFRVRVSVPNKVQAGGEEKRREERYSIPPELLQHLFSKNLSHSINRDETHQDQLEV